MEKNDDITNIILRRSTLKFIIIRVIFLKDISMQIDYFFSETFDADHVFG